MDDVRPVRVRLAGGVVMSMLRRWIAPFLPAPRVSTDAEILAVEAEIERAADPLAAAGEAALQEALRLWRFDIIDPKRSDKSSRAILSKDRIEEMIRSCGWDWELPYAGDGDLEWCGIFAGHCWRAAIPQSTLRAWWPSTYRLDRWASYTRMDQHVNKVPADHMAPLREYGRLDEDSKHLPWPVRPGDILMVGDGKPGYGDHITLVERYDADERMFYTVEGNGVGVGPTGERRQGVVRAKRPLGARKGHSYIARRLIRPAVTDLL